MLMQRQLGLPGITEQHGPDIDRTNSLLHVPDCDHINLRRYLSVIRQGVVYLGILSKRYMTQWRPSCLPKSR